MPEVVEPTARRPSVFRLALRRQLAVGVAWWLGYFALRYPGAYPTLVAGVLLPAAFAWSMRAYRIATALFVVSLAVSAANLLDLHGLSGSEKAAWSLGVALQCSTFAPARFTRRGNLSDIWAYAGPLRLLDAADGLLRPLSRLTRPLLLLGSLLTLLGLLLLVSPYRAQEALNAEGFNCGSVFSPRQSAPADVDCDQAGRAANDLTLVVGGLALARIAVLVVRRRPRPESSRADSQVDP